MDWAVVTDLSWFYSAVGLRSLDSLGCDLDHLA
jgi:hypothetical protein